MKKFGPALLVTAAFIGPGTVTTATLAGGTYGYALVWALLFSIVATFVLQEMASRLGIVTGKGLAEAIRDQFSGSAKILAMLLIISAIGIGNAAYQAGNITGAAISLVTILGGTPGLWSLLIGVLAAALLFSGRYQLIEKALMTLVMLMSAVFIITMFIAQPDWAALFSAVWQFDLPDGASLMLIALIGTTIVPYNLFLHASVVARQSKNESDKQHSLHNNRIDASLSIGLGGLITLAILSCSASAFFASKTVLDTANLANQLSPLLGQYASVFFALGLFSAGLTSAITAPLAAAYAVCGALGWHTDIAARRFKVVWLSVIVVGIVFASVGIKPLAAILFAQATNGVLLPIIAVYLIWTMNNQALLGQHKNGWLANLAGGIIVVLVSALGLYKVSSLFL